MFLPSGETDEDNIFNYFNNFEISNDDMKLIMTDFYSRILANTNGLNIYDSFNLKFNNFKEDIKSSILI